MKTNILYLLLGIFITISIASTVPQVKTIFQPSQPISTVAFTESQDNVDETIIRWANKGYQVQNMAGAGGSTQRAYTSVTVVMVKY